MTTKRKAPAWQGEGKNQPINKRAEGSVVGNIHQTEDIHDIVRKQWGWLRDNASAVAAARPAWADTELTWVDGYRGEVTMMIFERLIGTVKIEQTFDVDGAAIIPMDPPVVRMALDGLEANAVNHEDASQVGMDLIRAAQTINGPGDISVTMIEIVAKSLGVCPGDIFALGAER